MYYLHPDLKTNFFSFFRKLAPLKLKFGKTIKQGHLFNFFSSPLVNCIAKTQCCGSRMFIPDPDFFLSRIRIVSIPDPQQRIEVQYFIPPKWLLSSWKYDPGCSSRIRILIFYPSRIPDLGGEKARILDPIPDPRSRIPDPGSQIPDHRSRITDPGSQIPDPGSGSATLRKTTVGLILQLALTS